MKSRLIISLPIMVLMLMVGGCGNDTSTRSDIPNAFKGSLSLVVLTESDSSPTGVEGVPVVVTVGNQVDPGPYTWDTVYTNEYGVAYFMKTVGCASFDSHGKLVIAVGNVEPFTVFFADGEHISEIIDYDSLGSMSR